MRNTLNDYSLKMYIHGRDRMERALERVVQGSERGQTTAEYIAVLVLVAGVVGVVASSSQIREAIGQAIQTGFERVANMVSESEGG